MAHVIGYIINPSCPECNGLAGDPRKVAYGIRWAPDFPGDGSGRRNVFETQPFHCRKCAVYGGDDAH